MTPFLYRLLRPSQIALTAGAAFCLFAGCASHQPHKSKSYDRNISEGENDPTYHEDFERADEEVRTVR